jgi:CRP/FNR family cyclic AMP-dependent transcriptional regulator
MVDLLDLRKLGLFEGLSAPELELMSSILEYRRCGADVEIVDAGSSDRGLFMVYAGSVRIVKRDEAGIESGIAEVLPGQHFGEVTFVASGQRSATALTNEPTELLVLDPIRFQKLAEEHPAVAQKVSWALLTVLCGRLRNTVSVLFDFMEASALAGVG